jgi:hypothetical protein
VAMGGRWPAARELAGTATTDRPALRAAVERLAEQSAAELSAEGLQRIPFWDVGVGLLCRGARLGIFGSAWPSGKVLGKLDLWWWDIRDEELLKGAGYTEAEIDSPGIYAIWAAMKLRELQEFGPEPGAELALVAEGERLIPPYSVNASFCTAFVLAVFGEL